MKYDITTILIVAVCLTSVIVHLAAEWRGWPMIRIVSKLAASTAFVLLAGVNGAAETPYGVLILLALVLSWVGDALLLSLKKAFLTAGIAAFFAAHLAFVAAFGSEPLNLVSVFVSALVLGAAGLVFLRWLWKYLDGFYKIAVPLYLVAITIMTSLAIGTMSPLTAIGAIIFTASDVSVARDRFVARDIVNKTWGLPLYYLAEILFAMSVVSHR